MDCGKVGEGLVALRKEKRLTQRQVADALNISDKAVSKWERGLGCPDVSLLGGLSALFGVPIEKILSGDLHPSDADGGNMKKLKFYVCPACGSVVTATGESEISCCGRKLDALTAQPEDEEHKITVEIMDDEYDVKVGHEMSKDHFISFVALVSYDRVLVVKLYPEQDAEVRLPRMHRGKLYVCCSRHGLREKSGVLR